MPARPELPSPITRGFNRLLAAVPSFYLQGGARGDGMSAKLGDTTGGRSPRYRCRGPRGSRAHDHPAVRRRTNAKNSATLPETPLIMADRGAQALVALDLRYVMEKGVAAPSYSLSSGRCKSWLRMAVVANSLTN